MLSVSCDELRFRVPFDCLDLATVDEFGRWWKAQMSQCSPPAGATVVLDLGGVELVMAAGVRALLELEADLADRGVALRLGAPAPIVARVLRTCDVADRWVR